MRPRLTPAAFEAARDEVERRLSEAFAADLLDADELDGRMERLARANDSAELESLVHDLPGDPSPPAETALVTTGSRSVATAASIAIDRPDNRRIVSVLSDRKQVGHWVPAARNEIRTFIGESLIDLRAAALPPGETIIHVQTVLGDTRIVVPPGVSVQVECSSVLADIWQDEATHPSAPHPDAPRIRITGFAVLSELGIELREDGESRRQARRRRRRERKLAARSEREKRRALKHGG